MMFFPIVHLQAISSQIKLLRMRHADLLDLDEQKNFLSSIIGVELFFSSRD
jgi:hypothetical protein